MSALTLLDETYNEQQRFRQPYLHSILQSHGGSEVHNGLDRHEQDVVTRYIPSPLLQDSG